MTSGLAMPDWRMIAGSGSDVTDGFSTLHRDERGVTTLTIVNAGTSNVLSSSVMEDITRTLAHLARDESIIRDMRTDCGWRRCAQSDRRVCRSASGHRSGRGVAFNGLRTDAATHEEVIQGKVVIVPGAAKGLNMRLPERPASLWFRALPVFLFLLFPLPTSCPSSPISPAT
ncbi:MAG: hypothetical protein ACRYHA_15910 [Janthinobacterium lividum]